MAPWQPGMDFVPEEEGEAPWQPGMDFVPKEEEEAKQAASKWQPWEIGMDFIPPPPPQTIQQPQSNWQPQSVQQPQDQARVVYMLMSPDGQPLMTPDGRILYSTNPMMAQAVSLHAAGPRRPLAPMPVAREAAGLRRADVPVKAGEQRDGDPRPRAAFARQDAQKGDLVRRHADHPDNRPSDNRQPSDCALGALNLDAGSCDGPKRTPREAKGAQKPPTPKSKETPVLMEGDFPDLAGNARKESEKTRTVAWGPPPKRKEEPIFGAHTHSEDQPKSDVKTALGGEPWPSEADVEGSKKPSEEADEVPAEVDEIDAKTEEAAMEEQPVAEDRSETAAADAEKAECDEQDADDSKDTSDSAESSEKDEVQETSVPTGCSAVEVEAEGALSVTFLLKSRMVCAEQQPVELVGFEAQQHELGWTPGKAAIGTSKKGKGDSSGDGFDRSRFGISQPCPKSSKKELEPVIPLVVSENAYKVARPNEQMSRALQLRREVNCLLNKVCPDNIDTIIGHVANVEVGSVEELELLIALIFKKALAEPHYCETYADMVAALKQRVPEFPSPDGKSLTFKAALLNATQGEFESLSEVLTLTADDMNSLDIEEIELLKKKRKDRVLANMKFIGNLFLRKLLSAKIIGSVIQQLVMCDEKDQVPQEPMVECICELITSIGFTLEESPAGKSALVNVFGRLAELKQLPTPEGRRGGGLYSKRIQFAIQDLVDLRAANWAKKSFKVSAKTKEEIRKEQEQDLKASGKIVPVSRVEIAGARPNVEKAAEDGDWETIRRR